MKKVLIISDEQELLKELEQSLSSNDFSLHALPGHEDILAEVVQLQPDLVLIDFLLGNINGGSLCHQIRVQHSIKHLPIVLLSEYPNIERFTAKFGCNAIIRKPVKAHELIELFNSMLERKEPIADFLHRAS